MRHVGIRGSVAAIATAFVLGYGIASPAHAQKAAHAANPELAAQGEWDPATTYVIDDIVTARGSAWISLRNNNINRVPGQTNPSTALFWQLFARGFNPTGAWSSATTYQPDDLVTQNGQTYRAKLTNINKPVGNTNNWELLAAKGAMGATGADGPQGPAGPNTGVGAGTASEPSISFDGDADTGIYSPADGKIALVENGETVFQTRGCENVGVGVFALSSVSIGVGNTAVGDRALLNNTTGGANTGIGRNALMVNSSGSGNTAVGRQALASNTTGASNTAVGANALTASASNSSDNTAIGSGALQANTNSQRNTAVGSSSLSLNQIGERNVAIGALALNTSVTASHNIAIGDSALRFTTGGSNIAIGSSAGISTTATSNSIFIGNSGEDGDVDTTRIGGTQTKAFMAGISGVSVANNAAVLIDTTTGQLGTAVSSRRYKDNIEAMPDMSAMLSKLRPVTFQYKTPYIAGAKPTEYGLIAEEVADVFPDLAVFNTDGAPETVKYHLLPSFLLAGYQAQQQTIARLAEKIEALEAWLARLEAPVSQSKAASLRQ